ncbi:hypothetical protein V8B55DRAFT_1433608 [Mucor lusitanicus]
MKIDNTQWATTLSTSNVECKTSLSTENYAGGMFSRKMVRIDVVGAFYDKVQYYITECRSEKGASKSFLAELSLYVDKRYCVLYFDGVPLANDISSTNQFVPATVMVEADTMIEIDAVDLGTLCNTAENDGWCVFVQDGKARDAIVKEGGIAVTHDSSMLNEPSITAVIRPYEDAFYIYNKRQIIPSRALSD